MQRWEVDQRRLWHGLIINGAPRSDAGAALLANPPAHGQAGLFHQKTVSFAVGRDTDVCNRKIATRSKP